MYQSTERILCILHKEKKQKCNQKCLKKFHPSSNKHTFPLSSWTERELLYIFVRYLFLYPHRYHLERAYGRVIFFSKRL